MILARYDCRENPVSEDVHYVPIVHLSAYRADYPLSYLEWHVLRAIPSFPIFLSDRDLVHVHVRDRVHDHVHVRVHDLYRDHDLGRQRDPTDDYELVIYDSVNIVNIVGDNNIEYLRVIIVVLLVLVISFPSFSRISIVSIDANITNISIFSYIS